MTRRLKVALLAPSYRPEVHRGAERVIGELAGGLRARGCEPRLITSHPGPSERTVEDGVAVVRNRRPPERLLLARGFQEHLTHVPLSYATLRSGSDDLAHAHFPTDALAAIRWGRERGRPVVLSYHGVPNREVAAARRLRLRVLEAALEGSGRVIVSSRAAAEAMRRWFGIEAEPIHPGVRADFFAVEAERFDRPTIVCAADPDDARKRVPMLVRALGELRRYRPDAELLLARPRGQRLAERCATTPGVRLFDPTGDAAALAAIYARAWVSALAAYDEAFGLVLAEALACGTPVVGARDGGVPEIVCDDGVGRLFDRDDEEGLVRALDEALELAGTDDARARCRARAGRFTSERMCDAHLALYRELLG